MSVRSDPNMTSTQFSGMEIAPTLMSSGNDHVSATISAAQNADSALGEANALSTNHPDHPLRRTFVTSIRASLGELCLRKARGTWAPSQDALRAMLQYTHTRARSNPNPKKTHTHTNPQKHTHTYTHASRQKKFVDLSGSAELSGDLKVSFLSIYHHHHPVSSQHPFEYNSRALTGGRAPLDDPRVGQVRLRRPRRR